MSIIPDIRPQIDTQADDQRRSQYMAALSLIEQLIATTPVLPANIEAECHTWAPDQVTIRANAHKDLPAVKAWHAHFGGELTTRTHASGQVNWSTSTVIDGIRVELWTLLDAPAEDGAR